MEWVYEYDFSANKEVLTTDQVLCHALSYTHSSGELESLREKVERLQETLVLVVSKLPSAAQVEIVKTTCSGWKPKGEDNE